MEKKEPHFLGKINIIAKKVDAITFDFLWDGKPHKIKKLTIIGEKEKGGREMIPFLFMNKALKST